MRKQKKTSWMAFEWSVKARFAMCTIPNNIYLKDFKVFKENCNEKESIHEMGS